MSNSRYLEHHGVEGMHWGVRRYQNYDGSLTDTGRKHYGFNSERSKILKEVSRDAKQIVKESIDISKVKERGNLSTDEAIQCSKIADRMFNRAYEEEPKITRDILSTGSNMYGLDKRLKQPTSLAGKIGQIAKKEKIDFNTASKRIKDSIRYTTVSDDNNFVNNYLNTKKKLIQKGYTETQCKNYFEKYKNGEVKHKSVQSNYRSPNGYEFEIQFQTPSSQAAKNLKVPLYEEVRKSNVSYKRKQYLEKEMMNLAENVTEPKNISSINSYNKYYKVR